MRELWVRLAQMETDKLRAVELAVEEERKRATEILTKEKLVMDRERREVQVERDRLSQDRIALDQQIEMFKQSQAREADLVNKLQVNTLSLNLLKQK